MEIPYPISMNDLNRAEFLRFAGASTGTFRYLPSPGETSFRQFSTISLKDRSASRMRS